MVNLPRDTHPPHVCSFSYTYTSFVRFFCYSHTDVGRAMRAWSTTTNVTEAHFDPSSRSLMLSLQRPQVLTLPFLGVNRCSYDRPSTGTGLYTPCSAQEILRRANRTSVRAFMRQMSDYLPNRGMSTICLSKKRCRYYP